jgi:hypothetical protein
LPRLSSSACFGRPKKGKYQKWGDNRHMEVGQDRELYPNLPLIGEALHCSTPPTPRNTQTEGKKSGLERGWCGKFKRKAYPFFFLGQSTHRQKADILSFPSRGRPPTTFYPITVFSSLGAKKKSGIAGYCGTAYAVPRQGNQ